MIGVPDEALAVKNDVADQASCSAEHPIPTTVLRSIRPGERSAFVRAGKGGVGSAWKTVGKSPNPASHPRETANDA